MGQGPVSGNIPSATAKGPGARSAPAWGRLARPLAPLLEAGWPRANPADPRPAIAVKGSFRGDWDLIPRRAVPRGWFFPYSVTPAPPPAPVLQRHARGSEAAPPCRAEWAGPGDDGAGPPEPGGGACVGRARGRAAVPLSCPRPLRRCRASGSFRRPPVPAWPPRLRDLGRRPFASHFYFFRPSSRM